MTILFYILVIFLAMFFVFGKLTSTNAFMSVVMFIVARFGGLYLMIYSLYQLAIIWGYVAK